MPATLVADVGQDKFRLGRSGESCPSVAFPAQSGGDGGAMVDGLVADWDQLEKLWERALASEALGLGVEDAPLSLVLAEPWFNKRSLHQKYVELVFEKFGVGSLFSCKTAVLCCYANGRTTGLVVEAGETMTCTVPIHEGFIMQAGANRSSIGGGALTQAMRLDLEGGNRARGDWGDAAAVGTARAVKEGYCSVSPSRLAGADGGGGGGGSGGGGAGGGGGEGEAKAMDVEDSRTGTAAAAEGTFTLPDGKTLVVPGGPHKVPELLFDSDAAGVSRYPGAVALQDMVLFSVSKCDLTLRKDLFANIVLGGGTSSFDGLPARLTSEVTESVGGAERVRVLAAAPEARASSAWIGGSIIVRGAGARKRCGWVSVCRAHGMWLCRCVVRKQ
jgi:hypothetical protein